MKVVLWTLALVLALCSSHVLGQSKKKDSVSLGEKVQQLIDSSAKRPVIRLNGNKFRDYVRNSPRNYSIVVMFTALSAQRQCAICKQASEEYQVVANCSTCRGSNYDFYFFYKPDILAVRIKLKVLLRC